jgi:uracil-DNA glycosylase
VKEYSIGKAAFMTAEINMRRTNAIVDRGFFSEVIYSMIDENRKCGFNLTQLWRLSLYSMRAGCLFLVLWQPNNVLEDRYKDRMDERDLQQIFHASCIYKNLSELWWTPTEVTIVCEHDIPDEKFQEIIELAELVKSTRRRFFESIKQGWGRLTPGGVVIIGERINPRRTNREGIPFYDHRDWSSSGYLFKMLSVAGLRPRDVFIANAYTPSGQEHSARFISELRPKVVIALGKKALDWCVKNRGEMIKGLDNGDAPTLLFTQHPSYLKRFWHDFAEDFGLQLKKDLNKCYFKK